jgi:GcrA cell cycle regulator
MNWTTTEDERILKLWAEGNSSSVIADIIGRSRNSVIGRLSRLRKEGQTVELRGKVMPPVRKPRAVKPKPVPAPTETKKPTASTLVSGLVKSLLNLRANQCRWPLDDKFCDEVREDGRPYCAHHRKLSFRPAPPRKRRGVRL